ncbi:hypothetical protein [Burkholderia pseudomallei]|uniref:hypothetical protein n=1 Tax=Burkholderia pseudomallei TaxID=28450 RepID=UPI00117891E3|nr:hypothetical protein [Burkholderia pseudomallei]
MKQKCILIDQIIAVTMQADLDISTGASGSPSYILNDEDLCRGRNTWLSGKIAKLNCCRLNLPKQRKMVVRPATEIMPAKPNDTFL